MPNESRKKALVIAVSQYEKLDKLEFCEKDGKTMLDVLMDCGYEIERKDLIGNVTGADIQVSVNEFFDNPKIRYDDTLLFYFSGHGLPKGKRHYLASSDIDPKTPGIGGLSFSELTDLISDCKSECVITILDSCYAGAAGKIKGTQKARREKIKSEVREECQIKQGRGRCFLFSCEDYEESRATRKGEHSFFTKHLIEGLRGASGHSVNKQGSVTPESLMGYIRDEIDNLPEDERVAQTPVYELNDALGKIILASFPHYAHITTTEQSLEEHLKSLLREGKIKEFNTLKKQNPDLLLRLELASIASGVSLRDIDLSNAIIAMIDFEKRDLQRAIFIGATLSGVNFRACNLQYAKLNKVRGANAYFEDADLRNADLSQSDFYAGNFKNAKLENVDFIDTDLRKANFEGVVFVVQSTNFKGARLSEAIFRNAKLDKINLQRQNLSNGDFEGASLQEAQLEKADLNLSKLNRTDLSRALLRGANLSGSDLREANLMGADLTGADLSGADLSDATLRSAVLERANLRSANLSEADLEGADLYFADLDDANVEGANLKNSILKGTNFMKIRGLSTNPTVDDSAFDDEPI